MGYVRFKSNPEVFQMHVKVIGDNMVQLYPPIPNVDVTAGLKEDGAIIINTSKTMICITAIGMHTKPQAYKLFMTYGHI